MFVEGMLFFSLFSSRPTHRLALSILILLHRSQQQKHGFSKIQIFKSFLSHRFTLCHLYIAVKCLGFD